MIVFLSLFNSCIHENTKKSGNIAIVPKPVKIKVLSGNFLLSNNSAVDSVESLNLAKLYVSESKIEGINHDIAFCQMCLETGFLKFDGIINPDQNNFCGLGATGISEKGEVFSSKRLWH